MRNKYKKEVVEYVRKIADGRSIKEILEKARKDRIEEKYGIELTESRISNLKHRYGIKSNVNAGAFKKGMIPHNKGKKMSKELYEKCRGTMFEKGNIPADTREVGEEYRDRDGYIYIKVNNDGNKKDSQT